MVDISKLETFVQSSPFPAWLATSKGSCVYANLALGRLTGLDSDQTNQAHWSSFLLEEDQAIATASWQSSLRTGDPYRARVRMRGFGGLPATVELIAFGQKVGDGRELWLFAGLHVDSVTQQSPQFEAQLQFTLNMVPAYAWYAAASGALTFVNERTADYLELPEDHPLRFGTDVGGEWDAHIPLLHPDDQEESRRVWATCLRTGSAGQFSQRVRNAGGAYRWFLSRAEPLRASDGTLLYWVGVNLDIEERKQAEFYLAEGERLAHMGSWAFNPTGFDYWSRELFHIHGINPAQEAPSLEGYLALVHPEDRGFMASLVKRVVEEASGFDVTKRIIRPNGEVRYVRCVGTPVVENGTLKRIVGTAIDVTEHELLTHELRCREAYLTEAQRLSQTGSFGWKPESGEIFWSDETYRIFEFDRSLKPTINLLVGRVHPEDRADFQKVIDRASAGATDFEHAYRMLLPNGRVKHVHALARALQDASGNREFVGAATDVTSIKRAEEELRKSENYLAEGQRLTHVSSWAWQVKERDALHLSDEWYRIYGFNPKEGMPAWEQRLQRVHPEDREKWQTTIEQAIHERSDYDVEFRIVLPDGTLKWIRTVGHPRLSTAGELVEFVGSSMDVTERKQGEQKLQAQEMELRQVLDLTPQLVAVYGPNRERLYANRIALEYLGMSLDEWRQRPAGVDIHPEDLEKNKTFEDRGSLSYELELRVRKGDGSYRWFLCRYNPLCDDKGNVFRWYVAATDIDDRKQAEDRLRQENAALREEIDETSMFEEIVGTSSALRTVLSRICKVAPSDSTVLVSGETGTGKELIARAVHKQSRRSGRAFVSVNCAALAPTLISSELFGHEKGAFTGATQRRVGRFELANGGTIFLDEVGELLPDTQAALLRVLQEREFERVGGGQPIRVDVRVIAATNRDLEVAVANGAFRQDLFYRLNVFPIEVPPLRDRKADILMLIEYFVQRYATKLGRNIRSIDKKTLDLLRSYDWPGNIRELQNVIERSVILSSGDVFFVDELWLSKETFRPSSRGEAALFSDEVEGHSEREIIEAALTQTRGRVSGPLGAAAKLRIPPSTLDNRIRALKIDKKQFKFR